jgi:ribonuclease D|tara:strand:+ start:2820 stop:3653 length:834 start_codon:yes stop_codon:yes gene_type:complete
LYTYIETVEDLSFLNEELLEKSYLGVDTEFRRTTKDNMRLALLQINDGEEIYLIDTILIDHQENVSDFLFSNDVTKIFHSCKEDLEAVYSWTGRIMENIFDTQLANAFIDGQYSIGYQGLVEERLDIILDKNETRSNWIRRPLTESQLNYAASDVQYLIHLFEELQKELVESKKIDWLYEDLQSLVSSTFEPLSTSIETRSKISKNEEINLLNKFNEIVINVSTRERINSTLLFSKKNQKDFIRVALGKGLEEAFQTITLWRKELIQDSVKSLLLQY